MYQNKKGFTLIKLLVVIAIIALLHDNQVNLWGNEDAIVHNTSNERKLTPYLGKAIGECPADKGYQPGSSLDTLYGGIYVEGNFYEVYGSSYVYNTAALNAGSRSDALGVDVLDVLYGAGTSDVKESDRLVMIADRTLFHAYHSTYYGIDYFKFMKMHDMKEYLCNMGFVDGHVSSFTLYEPPDHFENADYRLTLY